MLRTLKYYSKEEKLQVIPFEGYQLENVSIVYDKEFKYEHTVYTYSKIKL